MQRVIYDKDYTCRFHSDILQTALEQVPGQVSLPVGFSTWPSAFCSPGIFNPLLVSHRYFSQFQVVTKMDDHFPSVVKLS